MKVSELMDQIQASLEDEGVYRTDDFILDAINDGYKMMAVLTLFDERRVDVEVDGTRNYVCLPKDGDAECIAPLYVANKATGKRVHPVNIRDMEYYSSAWEGKVGSGGDAQYYWVQSPYHYPNSRLLIVPMQNIGGTSLSVIGAFVPTDLTPSDEPRIPRGFQDALYYYARFLGFTSEPTRGNEAAESFGHFIDKVNALAALQKSRFPSHIGFEPQSVEFLYENVSTKDFKAADNESN